MASGLIPRGRGSTEIITQTLTVSGAADINFLHVTALEADSATIGALTVTTINGSPVPPGGFGDVIGPASSVDNSVARFDGITGKLLQSSVVIIDDAGAITGVTTINGDPIGNVDGPASSVADHIASFTDATGKLIKDSGMLVTGPGSLSGTNTGDVSLSAFGVAPNANAASLVGQALTLQPASATFPGGVSTGIQTLAGAKTFVAKITSPNFPGVSVANDIATFSDATGNVIKDSGMLVSGAGTLSGTNTGDVTLSPFGAAPNANAATLVGQALTLQPASATQPGGVSTGVQTLAGAKTFATKITSPNFPGVSVANDIATFSDATGNVIKDSGMLVTGAGTLSGTNTGDVTLAAFDGAPNANGASLAGQVLTLQPASATFPGGVSTVAQSFLGTKFFTNGIQLNAAQSVGDTITLSFFETSQPVAQLVQWSGPFAVNPTATRAWGWDKIGPRGFVDIAGIQAAAALLAPAIITSTLALPAFMRPPSARIMNIDVVNNSTVVAGTLIVLTTGFIQIGVGFPSTAGTLTAANNFGILGNNGFIPWQVQYVI